MKHIILLVWIALASSAGVSAGTINTDTTKIRTSVGTKPIALEEIKSDTLFSIGKNKYRIKIHLYHVNNSFFPHTSYGDNAKYNDYVYDNEVKVNIFRNGKSFFEKIIMKSDFESYTGTEFQKIATLYNMTFESFNEIWGTFNFMVSIGEPDTDNCYFIPYQIDRKGNVTFSEEVKGGND
ncbi:MAG: DUF4738 domain-containing protein [Acidobacteriota bacterium]